ncbi:hypothetical protein HORM4_240074 [Vibrio harveyi]|nr:hypothetical protein HORM4_240074 [Vibrio harveyi]
MNFKKIVLCYWIKQIQSKHEVYRMGSEDGGYTQVTSRC